MLLDNRASDEDGRKLPYLIGDVDDFLLRLVVLTGSPLAVLQQVVGHRAEVIAEVASHDKTKEYLKIHTQ
ncbi:hypothetical protein HMPREF0659_A5699 [Prevotella melaninogenica ATCC 25845]|nr:hypothetical protein HMPREF0659_A5699 [Prevotella melaninogenica ATCC 25845]